MEDTPSELPESIKNVYQMYCDVIHNDVGLYEARKRKLVLPRLPQQTLAILCKYAGIAFGKDDMVMGIEGEVLVVGDLHGHILDLFRILQHFGLPPTRTYLFLGDLIDRGEFSIETATLIFLLKVLFPKNIYCIRGNHEFAEMCQFCGFSSEVFKVYGNTAVESSFVNAFAYMPLAAIVNSKYLCVHGGIGPSFTSISQISDIKRPLYDFNFEPALSILWSDPTPFTLGYKPSTRGTGFLYGIRPLTSFLESAGLQALVRGHECVAEGIKPQLNGKVITVFSASYYCGIEQNMAGVLVIFPSGKTENARFPALRYLLRSNASIVPTDCKTSELVPPKKVNKKRSLPKLAASALGQTSPMVNTGRPCEIPNFSTSISRPLSSMGSSTSRSPTKPRPSQSRGGVRMLPTDSRLAHMNVGFSRGGRLY